MSEDNTYKRPRDLEALAEAMIEDRNASPADVLYLLNQKGFFIVADTDIYHGPHFDEKEIQAIEFLATEELENVAGGVDGVMVDQYNADWARLEIVAGTMARCTSILQKIRFIRGEAGSNNLDRVGGK
jgi:hypothetical protein